MLGTTIGFLGINEVWNFVSMINELKTIYECNDYSRELSVKCTRVVYKYHSNSVNLRSAAPIATENSGPAWANSSARKAGVSSLPNGSA